MRLRKATAWTSATAVGVVLAAGMAFPSLAYADEWDDPNDEESVVLEEGSGESEPETCIQEANLTNSVSPSSQTGTGEGSTLQAALDAARSQAFYKSLIDGVLGKSVKQCGLGTYTWKKLGTGTSTRYTVTLTQPCVVINSLSAQSPVLAPSLTV